MKQELWKNFYYYYLNNIKAKKIAPVFKSRYFLNISFCFFCEFEEIDYKKSYNYLVTSITANRAMAFGNFINNFYFIDKWS